MSSGMSNEAVADSGTSIGSLGQSEESLRESISKSQKRWGVNPERSLFWGTGDVENKIVPGLYKCGVRDDVGPCFQQLIIQTDELIQLPDMVCNDVIEQIEQFWSDKVKEALRKRGFLHKRGILMYGEPGSGKTCTIQILVNMLIKMGGIAIYAEDPGVLSACLQLLRRIERDTPVIVILEDFDTLTDRDRRENNWLAVLDGEAQIDNVVFLATTNYIEQLDKRFVDRPSRFDVIVPVPMPTAKARAAYFRNKEPELTNDELYEWVQESVGFSIAHMKEMIQSIMCFGNTLEDTVNRLNHQRKRQYSNKDLEDEAKSSKGVGFDEKGGPRKRFDTREDFDEFVDGELAGWDYQVRNTYNPNEDDV